MSDVSSGTSGYVEVSVKPRTARGNMGLLVYSSLDEGIIYKDSAGLPVLCSQSQVSNRLCSANELGKVHLLSSGDASLLNQPIVWGIASKRQLPDNSSTAVTSASGTVDSTTTTSLTTTSSTTTSSTTTSTASSTTTSTASPTSLNTPSAITPVSNTNLSFRLTTPSSGYYCVKLLGSLRSDEDYGLTISFANPYGLLPAIFYPAMRFYQTIALLYLVIGCVWMYSAYKHWHDLLAMQHFVSGVIAFLVLEMAFNYWLYADFNKTGSVSSFLMGVVVIFNAGRISISFFMILIVSLGYGVMRPTLGSTMRKCILLAAVQFVFAVAYSAGTLSNTNNSAPSLALFLSVPLAMTMSAFYMWILSALTNTVQRLELKRQTIKLDMYRHVWYLLSGSAVAMLLVVVANTANMSHATDPAWIASQWRWRWMMLDGAMNTIYLVVFVGIAYLWRPTENNQRYGLDQLTEDDFEDDENAIPLGGVMHGEDEFEEFADFDYGPSQPAVSDGIETADDVLKWIEKNVGAPASDKRRPHNRDDSQQRPMLHSDE